MVKYSTKERKFMFSHFFETRNGYEVVRGFQQHFPNRPIPALSTVLYNFRKYERHGTSENRNRSHSGRRRTVTDDTTTAELIQSLEMNSNQSCRNNDLGISRSSFSSITQTARWHPYKKMMIRHGLAPDDYQRRCDYSNLAFNASQH